MKKVFIKWTYTPKDFFSEEISAEETSFSVKIRDGEIELIINNYDGEIEDVQSKYQLMIESYFYVELLNKRTAYNLKLSSVKTENEDGTISYYLKISRTKISINLSDAHFVTKDKNGKIIYDSGENVRNNQLEMLKKMQNTITSNDILTSLFDSVNSSILDPHNELVHLYEIRDAIQTFFGSKSDAINKLNIEAIKWSDFGNICNELPLNQGRHRGRKKKILRDATKDELNKARTISKEMIVLFIDYLNNNL